MLGHTRRRHTSTATIKRIVKQEKSVMSFEEAMKFLLQGESQGAVALRGLRYKEGLTQVALGKILGIDQTNISKMERGIRPIGKIIAKKLASFFKTDYRIFL